MDDGTDIRPADNIDETPFEIDLARLGRETLEPMARAAEEIAEIGRALAKTGDNVVGELVKGEETFYEWNHCPDGDVYDADTGSQFFYHAHPADIRVGEHGHFHTFLRPAGLPDDIRPAPVADLKMPDDPNDALSHLIGISMDRNGVPICLFTTNRWVTGELWYAGADVTRMLDLFEIGHTQPSWPVNRWVGAMIRLFRPQIAALIAARDATIARWQAAAGGAAAGVFEDRDLAVASYMRISLDGHTVALNAAMGRGASDPPRPVMFPGAPI